MSKNLKNTTATKKQIKEISSLLKSAKQFGYTTHYDALKAILAEREGLLKQNEKQARAIKDHIEGVNDRAAIIVSLKEQISALQKATRAKDSEIQELLKDKARLDAVRHNSWDIRSFSMPSGGDDADIGWEVIEHHMAKPHERVVGRAYKDDPRAAIDDAMKGEG